MSRKANIIILAFFHLLVFVALLTIKTGHYHRPDHRTISFPDNGQNLTQAENLCLICSCELVPGLTREYHKYAVVHQVSKLYLIHPLEPVFRNPFAYFLLRAPPFLN